MITCEYEDLAHDVILKLPETVQDIPPCEIRNYIYRVAKNQFIDDQRKKRFVELTYEPSCIEEEERSKDYYDYIQQIRESDLNEFDRLWLDLYLDYVHEHETERCISKIASDFDWKGSGLTRQTISKHIKNVIEKLKK